MSTGLAKEDMRINWAKPTQNVVNLVRGLSPYPTAWTTLTDAKGNELTAKIFRVSEAKDGYSLTPGALLVIDGKRLFIGTGDGYVEVFELQLCGKKRMTTDALLRGFHLDANVPCK